MDGQERRVAKSLLAYWELWLILIGGAVACVKFYYTVEDLAAAQARWQTGAEAHRDATRNDLEAIRTRLTRLEVWKEDQK